MELADIKQSISEMDDESLRELLISIRSNRRITKAKPVAAKKATASAKKSEPTKVSTKKLIDNMSAEQAAAMLAMLTGGK